MIDAKTSTLLLVSQSDSIKAKFAAYITLNDQIDVSQGFQLRSQSTRYPLESLAPSLPTFIDMPALSQTPEVIECLGQERISTLPQGAKISQFMSRFQDGREFPAEIATMMQANEASAILYFIATDRPFRQHVLQDLSLLMMLTKPLIVILATDRQVNTETEQGPYTAVWSTALSDLGLPQVSINLSDGRFLARCHFISSLCNTSPPLKALLSPLIDSYRELRQIQITAVAEILAQFIMDACQHSVRESYPKDGVPDSLKARTEDEAMLRLTQKLEADLSTMEARAWGEIAKVLKLHSFKPQIDQIAAILKESPNSLFCQTTWETFGLSQTQLLIGSTIMGAMTGGAIDASVGGASFMIGTAVGGIFGALTSAAYALGNDKGFKLGLTKGYFTLGPVGHPNFPWILLERGLMVIADLSKRSHACRIAIKLGSPGTHPRLRDKLSHVQAFKSRMPWLPDRSVKARWMELIIGVAGEYEI